MTIWAAIEGELPFLRAEAEARFVDTFEFRKPTGFAMVGGVETETFDVLLTTLGRVKVVGGLSERDHQVGERTAATVTRELHIPWNSPAVPTGVIAVCTAVDDSTDPTLLNARLRIKGPAPGSQTTARRLQVSEVLT